MHIYISALKISNIFWEQWPRTSFWVWATAPLPLPISTTSRCETADCDSGRTTIDVLYLITCYLHLGAVFLATQIQKRFFKRGSICSMKVLQNCSRSEYFFFIVLTAKAAVHTWKSAVATGAQACDS